MPRGSGGAFVAFWIFCEPDFSPPSWWAHTANLVVELESEEAAVSDTISSEAARLGIGLYTMSRREDGSFRVRQEIDPQPLKERELKNVDELLANILRDDKDLRMEYGRAIRR